MTYKITLSHVIILLAKNRLNNATSVTSKFFCSWWYEKVTQNLWRKNQILQLQKNMPNMLSIVSLSYGAENHYIDSLLLEIKGQTRNATIQKPAWWHWFIFYTIKKIDNYWVGLINWINKRSNNVFFMGISIRWVVHL